MSIDTETLPPASKDVRGGLTPYLQIDGAMKAADFYHYAFGAKAVAANPGDGQGRTMHVHLHINGSSLMMSDPYPEHGHPLQTPQAFTLALHVDDIDAWFKRAVDAGCTVVAPISKMFWGDRYAAVRDPFGVTWALNEAAR